MTILSIWSTDIYNCGCIYKNIFNGFWIKCRNEYNGVKFYSRLNMTVVIVFFVLINCISVQAWFADVWNYSIVPYASEAVREGIALYGRRRHAAVDPLQHIKSTYPWREPNHSHVCIQHFHKKCNLQLRKSILIRIN